MSLYISAYKGILCYMRHLRQKNSPLNAFFAGFVSAFSILLDQNENRRIMIALYLSTRTMHFLSRWIWRHVLSAVFNDHRHHPKSPTQPSLPQRITAMDRKSQLAISTSNDTGKQLAAPQNSLLDDVDDEGKNHHHARQSIRQVFGILLMALSSSQILYAYVCEPDTLAVSHAHYNSFLTNILIETLSFISSHPWRSKSASANQSSAIPRCNGFYHSWKRPFSLLQVYPKGRIELSRFYSTRSSC